MKIGSFWGLTAPMLLIMYDETSSTGFKSGSSLLNNAVDSRILHETRKELLSFKQVLTGLPVKVDISDGIWEVPQDLLAGRLERGTVIPASDDFEVLDVVRRIVYDVLTYMLNSKDAVSRDKVQNRETFVGFVRNWVMTHTIEFSKITLIPKKVFKELKDTSGPSAQDSALRLLQEFRWAVIPDLTKFNLTDAEKSICYTLYQKADAIDGIVAELSQDSFTESEMFGISFQEFMLSKPTRLLALISHEFNQLKGKVPKQFFERVLRQCRKDLQTIVTLFSSVESYNQLKGKSNSISTASSSSAILSKFTGRKRNSLSCLKEFIDTESLTEQDVDAISQLYDDCALLVREYLNQYFAVQLSTKEWALAGEHLADIGVGGLNLYSLDLFDDMLRNVVFSTSKKVYRKHEEIVEYQQVIALAQALLDSLMPIGGAL